MADLLECLIQIKALGETLERVAAAGNREGVGVCAAQLADAERRYAEALGTDTGTPPTDPEGAESAAAVWQEFLARRRSNLAFLSRCTASQLGGPVEWPGRRGTTVADLVALMLANDTEVLGEFRRARPSPESRVPSAGDRRP